MNLKDKFYNARTGLLNAIEFKKQNQLQTPLKNIKQFIQQQEIMQIFKKPEKVKFYFSITANYPNEIMQLDLADFSNISSVNNSITFLLVALDVFTRKAYVIPMKTKNTSDVIRAIKEIFKSVIPTQITCDGGSEFISKEFKILMNQNNIKMVYTNIDEHNKLGVVDRFIQTLRNMLNKYMYAHETTKYINVLNDIVEKYNNSFNSGIESVPNNPNKEHIKNVFI